MKIVYPSDIPCRQSYARGWEDRAFRAARKAGRTMTDAKREANRRNSKLPRKRKVDDDAKGT